MAETKTKTRRVRVTFETDVKYRDTEPRYTMGVVHADWSMLSEPGARNDNVELINVETIEWCGCCGREIEAGYSWCLDCTEHRDPDPWKQPWDRTWFAIHGTDCPYQVGAV